MSIVYHHKQLNSLIIDWSVLCGDGPCYGNVAGLNTCNVPEIAICRPKENSLEQSVESLLKQTNAERLILLNLFEYMGPRRSTYVVRKIQKAAGEHCSIFLGGAIELACSEILRDSSKAGTYVLRTLPDEDNAKLEQDNLFVPIGVNVPLNQEPVRVLDAMLKSVGIEDTIEVLPSEQVSNQVINGWNSDWIIATKPDSTGNGLLDIINDRIQHLECPNIVLSGVLFRQNLWANKKDAISWIKSLLYRNPSINITILDLPWQIDETFLKQLRQLGVNKFCLQLSPSLLSSKGIQSLCETVDACAQYKIIPLIRGNLVRQGASWKDMRKMWALCDRIGADFIEMLGAVPLTVDKGPCANLCKLLSQSSLLFEYRHANTHVKIAEKYPEAYGKLHPSICKFYHVKMEQVRNRILAELSTYGVSQSKSGFVRQVNQEVSAELVDTSQSLTRININNETPSHSLTNVTCDTKPSDTAIIVVAQNNQAYLQLCLHSIFMHTTRCYDLFVIDCGNITSSCVGIPCGGRFIYERLPHQRLKSFATAWALNKVHGYRYVLILSSNACALKSDWLNEMISEMEQVPNIAALGLRYNELNYQENEGANYLLKYILSPNWRRNFDLTLSMEDDDLVRLLSVPGESRFNELTGWIQLYRGDILHQIGLPIVDDHRLKHNFWDSELSMRILAHGYNIADSPTVPSKLHYFGERYNSGIPDVSFYWNHIESDQKWLTDNDHEALAHILTRNNDKRLITQPCCYNW